MYVVRNCFQCRMAGVTDGTKDSQLAHPHPVYIPSSRPGSPLAVKHSRCVSHFVNCHSKISDQKKGGGFPPSWRMQSITMGEKMVTMMALAMTAGILVSWPLYLQLMTIIFAYLYDQCIKRELRYSLCVFDYFCFVFSFICSVY